MAINYLNTPAQIHPDHMRGNPFHSVRTKIYPYCTNFSSINKIYYYVRVCPIEQPCSAIQCISCCVNFTQSQKRVNYETDSSQ